MKELGIGNNTTWTDEQDISLHNQNYAEANTPFYEVSAGNFRSNLFTVSIFNTDLVGIWGGPRTWTTLGAGSALNTYRYSQGGAGGYNFFTVVGGRDFVGTIISSTEIFNGLTFSTASSLNVSKADGFSFGAPQSMMYGNGITGGASMVSNTSYFNGNTWTTNTNSPWADVGSCAFGSFNAGIAKAGEGSFGVSGYSASFNGSSWITRYSLSFPYEASFAAATGTYNNGLIAGGINMGGTYLSTTCTFNGCTAIYGTVMNITANKLAIAGLGTGAVMNGGYNGSTLTITQIYNGHMWSIAQGSTLSKGHHTMGGTPINAVTHGNSNTVAANICELFNQNTYRKLFPENINMAGNLGVLYNKDVPAVNKCSVKVTGFVHNAPGGSSNAYLVLKSNGYSALGYQTVSTRPEPDDYIIGRYDAVSTKLHVPYNIQKTYNIVKRWG